MVIVSTHATTAQARPRLPHPVLRATVWSSLIGLAAGLVLGLVTQLDERDGA